MLNTYLQRGSTGDAVRVWQEYLNKHVQAVDIDGVFGPETHAATLRAQQMLGVADDGIVGPETWGAARKIDGLHTPPSEASRKIMPFVAGALIVVLTLKLLPSGKRKR